MDQSVRHVLLPLDPHSGLCTQCHRQHIAHVYLDEALHIKHDTPPSRALCHLHIRKAKEADCFGVRSLTDCFLDSFSQFRGCSLTCSIAVAWKASLAPRLVLGPRISTWITREWCVPWSISHAWIARHRAALLTELLSLEWLKKHLELGLEPELKQRFGLELGVAVAGWLSLAIVEAILANDVFVGALRSRASYRRWTL